MPTTIRRIHQAALSALVVLVFTPLVAKAPPAPLIQIAFFELSNGNSVLGLFQTCRGLGSSSEVIEVRDGGNPNIVRKLPGRLDLSDVICTRSLSNDVALTAWRALVEQGNVDQARSNVAIIGYSSAAQPVARWNLTSAWPAELQVVGGVASTVELLRLVHEGIQRIAQ